MSGLPQVGDTVKGVGPIPFDVRGESWKVVKVLPWMGRPCWLVRWRDGATYTYPVPSELLTVVSKSKE